MKAPSRSQRVRKLAISTDYEMYNTKKFEMEDDPTSFEESMRSDHLSKWLEAMEDEMKSMNANKVWDLKIIPKGAKTVGCKWVYKIKLDSQGSIERDIKRDLWQKALRKEKRLITMRPFLQSHVKIPSES